MPVLAEGVDEGKEGIGVPSPGGRGFPAPGSPDVEDFEDVVSLGLAQEHHQLRDVGGVDAPGAAGPYRVAAHAEKFAAQGVVARALERNLQDASLAGCQGQGVGETMLGSVRPGIIHAAEEGDLVGARVPEFQRYLGARREIPMAARRRQGDPGPGLLMAGGDAQPGSDRGGGCLCVRRCELRDPGLSGEIKQQELCGQRLDGGGGQPERGGGPAAARFHDDLDVSRQGGDGKR